MKKLILGTVQLGLDYGVNNKIGKPSVKNSYSILNVAYDKGIRLLDTASAYGDSEKIIGDFIKDRNREFEIVTKLKKLDKDIDTIKQLENNIHTSLKSLGISKIKYYLYHSFNDLVNNKEVFLYLQKLINDGIIEKIGVSIYDEEELEYIIKNLSEVIKFVQIPFNIFDLRWLKNDLLKRVKEKNIEIAARSIYLQGLFFVDKDTAYKVHPKAYDYIMKLKNFSSYKGVNLNQLAMSFVKYQPHIDYVLIGCESVDQLLNNIDYFNIDMNFSQKDLKFINESFGTIEKKIIDPRQW